jgi:prephenate dehydratase/chorismate mutase
LDIQEVRDQIDQIDFRILRLLNERMELALRTGKMKDQIDDPGRERNVLAKVRSSSGGVLHPEFTVELFSHIIKESKALQERNLKLVGFQGEHGAYGEVAINIFNPELVPVPCREFVDVFEGVAKNQLDYGMVPVENSLEGAVTQVNDLLISRDLKITGEVRIPVNHCLLALPETDYMEIKIVYSHPQALAQCREFLQQNRFEPRPYYDTAGSARMLSREAPKAAAVIASALCANLYNLKVLKEGIQDQESNSTRFFILARESSITDGNKSSLIVAAEHKAGALCAVLKIFADASVNLTRIESRPHRGDPGNYVFLLDFQGRESEPAVQSILEEVRKVTTTFKFLGCYREAPLS